MYQSVFKDIWGSDIIFAGPHKSFSNGNKSSNANHAMFGIHSVINSADEADQWTEEREYAMIADAELGLSVHPFPLNPQDILNVGGEIIPELEDLVNSCNHVLEELDPFTLIITVE